MADRKRKFQGIWIPAEIWLTKELSLIEKVFFVEICSLAATPKGCFASNKYFGGFFGVTKGHASEIVNNLIRKGWVSSTIGKQAGNRRYLKPLYGKIRIGSKDGNAGAIRIKPDTPIQKNPEHNNTNYNKIGNKTVNKLPKKSSQEILALDLKIAEEKKFFMQEINKIFRPNQREATTFARITKHLVEMVQAGEKDIGIFKDAIEWARQARASTAKCKKALFVSKIKTETGFKRQEMLLK